jgi:sugar lactone lactonase YvrE
MKQNKRLFSVLCVFFLMSLSLFAQAPLTSTMPATGVLGTTDFVTNTNYTAPTNSTFSEPAGVVVDPTTGKLFVADRDNRRVLRFSSIAKLINGSTAEAVFGQPDFVTRTANTGGISASTMNNPNALSIDASGRLWVADRDNNRILRFDNASTKPSSSAADGVLGQPDFVTNTLGLTAAKMNAPAGVFADINGRLWVADRANNRILRFDNAASKSNGASADGVLGQPDFITGTTGTSAVTLSAPWGVYVESNGRLWIADRGNSRVLRFDTAATKGNGASADGVLGQTTFTTSAYATSQEGLGEPRGVAVDASGRLFVADEGNTRIMVYNGAAAKLNGANADYVLGQADFISATAPAPPTATSLNYAISLFIDYATNQIWIPDVYNHRVLRFDVGPLVANGVLGTTDFVTNTNYTSPTNSTFSEPVGAVVDPTTGKLFVADRDNRRVLRFSSAAKFINGSTAEAVFGQPDFVTRTANTGGISASTMNNPNALYVDGNGTLWVADRDNNRVLRFDNASNKPSSSAADGVLGQPDFVTNTSGISSLKMNTPAGVFADINGKLWVADRANNRILRFDNAASKTNGGAADGVLGQPDFRTNTTGTTDATMSAPWGLYLDGNGHLWVADRGNSRVLRFDNAKTKVNGASADGVLGQTTFTTSTYATSQASLGEPRGVAVDASGRLFVADEGNTRIMVYNDAAAKLNGANADYVMGQVDFISADAPAPPTASSLNYALSLFIDYATNQIWLPDVYNHRVLRFSGFPVNVTAPAAPQNLSAVQGNTQVTLKWNKNTDANFYRYRIYGGTTANPTTIIDSTTSGISDTMRVIHGLTNSTKYYFRVTALNLSLLESGYSNEVNATPVTGIGVEGNGNVIPKDYSLDQNFPNPFNPSTTIKFGIPEASQVSLKIFDVLGREVTTLVNQELSAGYYSYQWNGVKLSSGIYIYRLTATYMKDNTQHQFTQVKKLLLQK